MAKIVIELEIESRTMNSDSMELLRLELRRQMLAYIFKAVDDVAERHDFRFSHKDVHVAGDIKLQD